MDEQNGARWGWRRRALIALAIFATLLIVFHRPLLQWMVHGVVVRTAARENLKLELRIEGSMLGSATLRNVRGRATGPSAVQSLEIELVRADYSLFGFLTGGLSRLLQSVEVRNASVILDPAKAPRDEEVIEERKLRLPGFFPNRLRLTDINLRVKSKPQDLIVEHLHLELNPQKPGELRIEMLQLTSGRNWRNVTAQTTYQDRNLFLRNLILDDQTHLRVVNLDASKIDANKLEATVQGTFAGAKIDGKVSLGERAKSLETQIEFAVEDTSLDTITSYLEPPELKEGRIEAPEVDPARPRPGFRGDVKRFAIVGRGQLDKPNSWNGSLTAEIENFAASGVVFDTVSIDAAAADGRATIKSLRLARGQNTITAQGSTELPARTEEFGRVPATFELRANVPDLGSLTSEMPHPVTGPVDVTGQINVRDATIHADLAATAGPFAFEKGSIEKLTLRIRAAKKMPPPLPDKEDVGRKPIPPPYYTNLESSLAFEASAVRFREHTMDSITADVRTSGKDLTLEQLFVSRAENRLTARGQYELPLEFDKAASQPGAIEFAVTAPNMSSFWVDDAANKITGSLQFSGQTNFGRALTDGYFNLYGTNLAMRNLSVPEVSAQGSIAQNVIYLNDLTARLNERDYISATGNAQVVQPHRYDGRLAADIADLSTFEPLMRAVGNNRELDGKLLINWAGRGEARTFKNSGKLNLTLEQGRYGELRSLQANVDATYLPDMLEVPIIFFRSDKLTFQAIAQAKGETLEVTKIQLVQDQAKYAEGYVSIPFVWKNLGTSAQIFPVDGNVLVTFQSENIDIKKLFEDVGMEAPASGSFSVKFDAHGKLRDVQARLDLQMRDLRSEQLAKMEPAFFALTAQLQQNELNISGKLEQARIQPLELSANLPFNTAKILRERRIPDATPVNAKVHLPRSNVNFVRQFVPEIHQLDGDVALDVAVSGTIGAPVFTGSGDMTINVARFENATLPALGDFKARLNFARDALTFEQFGGELAGGRFGLSGRVVFPRLTKANLDLHLTANSALVARNDEVTARADADVRVQGPLTSASVTGKIAFTDSQFLKNIDLIPIGLPGRPAPQPGAARPQFSFSQPPLRDWKFDVQIETKDPFSIRGNLAQGGAIVDLHLTGTGLRPGLEGQIRLENVEATLPFSRLEVGRGFLYFDPSDSLNPKIDLHGTSVIRDYIIHVYVYGTVLAPEAVFTSEPPLPQEEIISLLATGTTREELTGSNNVLAGRAALLLVQQLYRKIFKKGEQAKSSSIFDRLDVDFGSVDPRTGQQHVIARLKLSDQWVILGDVGVGGEYRGMLKYLIRFR